MTAALVLLGVILAANLLIWGALLHRFLGLPSVRIAAHPGRHVATQRIHAGGRYLGTQPRRDALPLTVQEIERVYVPGCPWTGEQAVLTDAATLALYRGDYGTMPVLEAERLTGAYLP